MLDCLGLHHFLNRRPGKSVALLVVLVLPPQQLNPSLADSVGMDDCALVRNNSQHIPRGRGVIRSQRFLEIPPLSKLI